MGNFALEGVMTTFNIGGAVAFRRVHDPASGIVGQGVIIGKYGAWPSSSPQARS
jgi:hypothetical protein